MALVATPSNVNITALDNDYQAHFWYDPKMSASFVYRWAIFLTTDRTFVIAGAADTALNAAIELNAQLAIIYA